MQLLEQRVATLIEGRRIKNFFLLGAVLAISFSVPVAGMLLFPRHLPGIFADRAQEEDALFPASLLVQGPGSFVRMAPGADLKPDPEKDFLVTIWFKLHKMPEIGKRIVILSKYDRSAGDKSGFMLGLSRTETGVRPTVFWKVNGERGVWHQFAEMNFVPRTWNLFALSLQKGRYLGLHAATRLQTGFTGPDLLGGYDLQSDGAPDNDSPLTAGVLNGADAKLRLGPVGVFIKREISENLGEILREMVASPAITPDYFPAANVRLWLTDGRDHARAQHKIEVSDRRAAGKPK